MSLQKPLNPWFLLFGRTLLFILFQALFALAFALSGEAQPWERGAAFWPLTVTLANLVCLAGMSISLRVEGKKYLHLFRIRREHIKSDLLVMLAAMLPLGPVGYFPNVLLAGWLLGGAQAAVERMLLPLPLWVVYASIALFPLTQGLVEIPTYFAYVMPRLQAGGLNRWLALTLSAAALGLQHIAVPLLMDVNFILWRGLMFLPFAFLVGLMMLWRPRLLPYIAVVHVLMDASFAAMLLGSAI